MMTASVKAGISNLYFYTSKYFYDIISINAVNYAISISSGFTPARLSEVCHRRAISAAAKLFTADFAKSTLFRDK